MQGPHVPGPQRGQLDKQVEVERTKSLRYSHKMLRVAQSPSTWLFERPQGENRGTGEWDAKSQPSQPQGVVP